MLELRDNEMLVAVSIPYDPPAPRSRPKVLSGRHGWNPKNLKIRPLGLSDIRIDGRMRFEVHPIFDPAILLDPNFLCSYDGSIIYSSQVVPKAITCLKNVKTLNRFGHFSADQRELFFLECLKATSALARDPSMSPDMLLEDMEFKVNPQDTEDFKQTNQWKSLIVPASDLIEHPDAGEYRLLGKNETRIVMKPPNVHQGKTGRQERTSFSWAWNRATAKLRPLNKSARTLMKQEQLKKRELPVIEACRRLDHNFEINENARSALSPTEKDIENMLKTISVVRDAGRDGLLGEKEQEKAWHWAGNTALTLMYGDPKSRYAESLVSTGYVTKDDSIPPRKLNLTAIG